jgi:hypothetical protein
MCCRVGPSFLLGHIPWHKPSPQRGSCGHDLFATQPGTQVNLGLAGIQPFVGVPLGSFDFGMGLGATFNTDTIVQRQAAVKYLF